MKNPNDVQVEQDWEIYWGAQGEPTSKIYDYIAEFYRKNIIIKILNFFLKKHFKQNDKVLHAGCGSGQVDLDANNYLNIKSVNPNNNNIVKGSIFELPFEDGSYDGIYNLGVMEHFTSDEINQILLEFKRVVKKGGKIVMFWPPTKGLTVNVLDSAHFVLNKILKIEIESKFLRSRSCILQLSRSKL